MRVLVVGDHPDAVELARQLGGISELAVGRVARPGDLPEGIGSQSDDVVVLPVRDGKDLTTLDEAVQAGAPTVVTTRALTAILRDAALEAGAADVIGMAEPQLIASALHRACGWKIRRNERVHVDLDATVTTEAGEELDAKIVNLSPTGAHVVTQTEGDVGATVPILIHTSGRAPEIPVHLRVVERRQNGARRELRGAFVGLLPAEEASLHKLFLELTQPVAEVEWVRFETMTAEVLRDACANQGTIVGLPLLPLSQPEQAGLAGMGSGSAYLDSMARVALARLRAGLLCTLYNRDSDDFEMPPRDILSRWRNDLALAQALVRGQIETADDPQQSSDLADLEARIQVGLDQLDWLIRRELGEPEPGPDPVVQFAAGDDLQEAATDAELLPLTGTKHHAPRPVNKARLLAGGLFLAVLVGLGAWQLWGRPAVTSQQSVTDFRVRSPLHRTRSGVSVAAVFVDHNGRRVATVDGSWYAVDRDARLEALTEIAGKYGVTTDGGLVIKNGAGGIVASVDASGAASLR